MRLLRLLRPVLPFARIALLAIAAVIAVGGGPFGHDDARAAQGTATALPTPDVPITVKALPTQGVADGQVVSISAEAPPGTLIYEIKAHYCIPNVDVNTSYDFSFTGRSCATVPIGSADTETRTQYPDGASTAAVDFRVGAGAARFKNSAGIPIGMICGPGYPCQLAVQLEITSNTVFYTVPVCFGDGCPAEPGTPAPQPAPPPAAGSTGSTDGGQSAAAPAEGGQSSAAGGSTTAKPATGKAAAAAAEKSTNLASGQGSSASGTTGDETVGASNVSIAVSDAAGTSRRVRTSAAAVAGLVGGWIIFSVINRSRRDWVSEV